MATEGVPKRIGALLALVVLGTLPFSALGGERLHVADRDGKDTVAEVVGKGKDDDGSQVYYLRLGDNVHALKDCSSEALQDLIGEERQYVYPKDLTVLLSSGHLSLVPGSLSCNRALDKGVNMSEPTFVENLTFRYIPTGKGDKQYYRVPLSCAFDFWADVFKVTRRVEVDGTPQAKEIIPVTCAPKDTSIVTGYSIYFDEVATATGASQRRVLVAAPPGKGSDRATVSLCSVNQRSLNDLAPAEWDDLILSIQKGLGTVAEARPPEAPVANVGCLAACTQNCDTRDANGFATALSSTGEAVAVASASPDILFASCQTFNQNMFNLASAAPGQNWEQSIELGAALARGSHSVFRCIRPRCEVQFRNRTVTIGDINNLIESGGGANCDGVEDLVISVAGNLIVDEGTNPHPVTLQGSSHFKAVTIRGADGNRAEVDLQLPCVDLSKPDCPGGGLNDAAAFIDVDSKLLTLEDIDIVFRGPNGSDNKPSPLKGSSTLSAVSIKSGGRLVLERSSIDEEKTPVSKLGVELYSESSAANTAVSELYCVGCSIAGRSEAVDSEGARVLISGTRDDPASLWAGDSFGVEAKTRSIVRLKGASITAPQLVFVANSRVMISDSVLDKKASTQPVFRIFVNDPGFAMQIRCGDQPDAPGCYIGGLANRDPINFLEGTGGLKIEDDVGFRGEGGDPFTQLEIASVLKCEPSGAAASTTDKNAVLLFRGRNYCA